MKNIKDIYTLHRYFIWADRMRLHFDNTLLNKDKLDGKQFKIDSFLYMSYWYAGLYVVIEGWQQLKLQDKEVNNLLNSLNTNLLKRYRHGVFHFQKEYHNERFNEFIRDGQGCVKWIRELREALSNYFLEKIKNI